MADEERTLNRFFLILGCCLGVLALLASLLTWSWWPLAALGIVLFSVAVLSLSEAAIFAPLLALVLRAGERKERTDLLPPSNRKRNRRLPDRRPGP